MVRNPKNPRKSTRVNKPGAGVNDEAIKKPAIDRTVPENDEVQPVKMISSKPAEVPEVQETQKPTEVELDPEPEKFRFRFGDS